MCGLSGALSHFLDPTETEAFQDLMLVSTLRGQCGAGVVVVPQKSSKSVEYHREPFWQASELAYSSHLNKLLQKAKSKPSLLMGHARAPTTGGFELEDTHPHICDHIIGMHNGTLAEVDGQKVGKNENDSRLLFQSIAKYGVREAIKACKGSYALVWIDQKDGNVYFLRNSGRPLYIARLKGFEGTMWWSSEKDMLCFVLGRIYKDDLQVFRLVEDTLIGFKIRPPAGPLKQQHYISFKSTSVPVVPPQANEAEKRAQAVVNHVNFGIGPPEQDTVTYVQTAKGEVVRLDELEQILAAGCGYCNIAATKQEYLQGKVHWVGKTEFYCDWCYKNDETAHAYVDYHSSKQATQ